MALWYLETVTKQLSLYYYFFYYFYFPFFVVLMKGHKISGMCERDEESKGGEEDRKIAQGG